MGCSTHVLLWHALQGMGKMVHSILPYRKGRPKCESVFTHAEKGCMGRRKSDSKNPNKKTNILKSLFTPNIDYNSNKSLKLQFNNTFQ